MFIIAPTPLPFAFSDANSSGRSSSFSKSIVIFSPPSPSGTLTFAYQCRSSAISKLSTPGISAGHLRGVVDHAPDDLARRVELLRPARRSLGRHLDVLARPLGVLQHLPDAVVGVVAVVTIAPPAARRASWIAAQMQWIPPPPPSPIPFVPSGVNGDGDSIAPVLQRRHVERVRARGSRRSWASAGCRPRRRRTTRTSRRRSRARSRPSPGPRRSAG